ncbi:hypothetical protein HYZ99_00525 [Candidatus Peregrinibacteria bacterium]|nr:hypothetical protein [Candidatus Peregrinibacteria bacterium]
MNPSIPRKGCSPAIQPLPDHVRKWLTEERHLTSATIERAGIRYAVDRKKKDHDRVFIPNRVEKEKVICWKGRVAPGIKYEQNDKWRFYPAGKKSPTYGTQFWTKEPTVVYGVEGELDCLYLLQEGYAALTSATGVGSFHQECMDQVPRGARYILAFDNDDDAGPKAIESVRKLVSEKRPDIKLCRVVWPEGFKKDVTDFALLCKRGGKDFKTEFEKLIQPCDATPQKNADDERPRIAHLNAPERPLGIQEWRNIISENFPELLTAAEIAVSTVAQFLIKDITNPFALVLIDVPAAGKTITINFFAEAGLPALMYPSDKFSPASFVSNAANVKREDLEKVDLLPRLKYRMFCIRDLATVFSAREDDLISNIGILTRVLDGEGLATDGGVHGQRSRTGDYLFMLLAASTPIPRRVWKVMGNQGPRLFFLGLHTRTKTTEELVRQLRGHACKEKELACRRATHDFLCTLWATHRDGIVWDKTKDQEQHLSIIARCASLLAKLRGTLNIDRERNDAGEELRYYSPVIEKPDRLNQLLYNLARAHAVVMGRDHMADDDMRCVVLLSCDSGPGHRAELLHAIIQRGGRMATGQIEKALNLSKPTALHEMDTLRILGICDEWDPDDLTTEKGIKLKEEFEWFCSEECRCYLHPDTGSNSPNSSPDKGN